VFATWGADSTERHAQSPADVAAPGADVHWVRAIDVAAPPAVLWRWICQLRVAPYSYDWVDNLGARSPQQLTPGLERLAVGQKVLRIFRIVDFARDGHVTIALNARAGGLSPYAMAYVITSRTPPTSRLVVHVRARKPRGILRRPGSVGLTMLSAVDLLMTRRQLRNLKALAERDAHNNAAPGSVIARGS
jgi:hypothetical protein